MNELIEEETEKQAETQAEAQVEAQAENYEDTSPSYKERDDLYSFFWKVVQAINSSKIANLDPKTELGMLNLTVRDCQRIALIGRTLKHKGFANFFIALNEITLSTSTSKKGMLLDLFVSQKKFTTKSREMLSPGGEPLGAAAPPAKKKWRLFRRKWEE